ncbi:DegT/DnrJ/EryC1/StrS family aminotransferase [Sulfurimonas sp.]
MIKFTYTSSSLGILTLLKAIINFKTAEQGRKIFREKIADFFSVEKESVFLFASARMGLYTFLKAINISAEDEVILPGYTCVVVSNAIKYAGAKAIYSDINPKTLNIDYDDLVNKITSKTKVIVISHNFGLPCDYIELIKSQYPEIYIVEDCAHTFGSKLNNEYLGTLADASFISHEYSKVITTGMGGTFILNNKNLHTKFQHLYNKAEEYTKIDIMKIYITLFFHTLSSYRYTVWLKRYFFAVLRRSGFLFASDSDEIKGNLPKKYPVKLHNFLAYIGALELDNIDFIITHNKKLATAYHDIFKSIATVNKYYNPNTIYVRYPIVIKDSKKLDKIIEQLSQESEFSIGRWFNDVVHPKGSFRYCYIEGYCTNGEMIANSMINFPMSIHITEKDIYKNAMIIQKIMA